MKNTAEVCLCGWGREAPKEQLYAHGETRYGKTGRSTGKRRGETHTGERAACKVDNDRQRAGVCRTRNHCEGT